jgi:hypothetical protein
MKWLQGKKTYITAIVYAVAILLNDLNIYMVPEYVYGLLASLGLITLRAGVNK